MKNIAIILAAGSGTRLGSSMPKQFLEVCGKQIIEHTIDAFQSNPNIDEIAIVCNAEFVRNIENLILKNGYDKVKKILQGGKERYHSTLSAIDAYNDGNEYNLLFHDAVRPMVSQRIIDECILALNKYNAVGVAIPSSDTLLEVENGVIVSIPNRAKMYQAQTPQAFKLSTIKKAYEIALQDKKFKITDDCGVVKKYLPNENINVVLGEESNIKITYKEDLFIIDKLFQLRMSKFESEIFDTY